MSSRVIATVLIAGTATYLIRWSFVAVAARTTTLPRWANRALRMIPPAMLATLVAPAVVRGAHGFDPWTYKTMAAVLTAVLMWRTRRADVAFVAGMTLATVASIAT